MNRTAAIAAVDGVAVLFSGMFAGFLTTVLVLEGSLRGFGAQVYTQVRLVELEHLDDLATALLPPAILAAATVTLVAFRHRARGRGRWLALTAVLLLLATLVISVSISLPINADQQNWSVLSPPDDWANVRDRWQLAHVVRTGTSILAFVLLTAAAMSPLTSAAPSASSNSRRARQDPTATAGSR
ncbi:MAG: hypothetical protein QOH27_2597 [Mycobacterium sp.]|nr:hypothetical protein [Mycobacterium sp.]